MHIYIRTGEHYTIPEFLRHAVFMLTDEQETLSRDYPVS